MEPGEYQSMFELEDTHWWFLGLRKLTTNAIRRHYLDKGIILDAGCGTGGLLRYINHHLRMKTIGVDHARAALSLSRKADRTTPVAMASIEKLPFPSDCFDIITSLDVLYIRGVDPSAALCEAFRVLRPGGILLLNLPAFKFLYSSHDRAVHTRHRYVRPEVRHLLQRNGFELVKTTYWNSMLFPLICLVRILRSRFNPDAVVSDVKPVPGFLNAFFLFVMRFENFWLSRFSFHFGSSIFAIARKPCIDTRSE